MNAVNAHISQDDKSVQLGFKQAYTRSLHTQMHTTHRAWQALVCLSRVVNGCWHMWESQVSSEHTLHCQLFTRAHTPIGVL